MGTGALPTSLSHGGAFHGEMGREMSPTAAHGQEGREAEGDYSAWREAQVKPLGKAKKKKKANSQAARLSSTG